MTRALITTALLILIFNIGYSQYYTISNCFLSDPDTSSIQIDSGSIWEIGTPTKAFQNGNHTGIQSIVTSLDSNYKNNDTSSFKVSIDMVDYLDGFEPLEISFVHRFQMHAGDYGEISISVNEGETWHVINEPNLIYYNNHAFYNFYEATGDTTFDTVEVTGFSAGWVHSKLIYDVNNFVWNDPNSTYRSWVKFTFYSDSTINMEGWQIDSICLEMGVLSGINEIRQNNSFQIAPNPANGNFSIKRESNKKERFTIFNNLGQIVKEGELMESEETIPLNLTPGIYFVRVSDGNSLSSQKLIVK